ncbi:MAG: hypothetical protein IPI00_10075 [Flavobacteriales bacterium]|nr:hypothetical protein [Flavobacteriales bacterium]MBK6944309.1 hypothetical protein [Flavobacteriales bacterium]MBK7240509.1 hypothetical protein [Flavobacteriales bacterium]MBK9533977.1 hypothetical protein [Flavobacteriales bacterium]HQV53471.1 hypothetical protein [Flavobacteriales bacterium]
MYRLGLGLFLFWCSVINVVATEYIVPVGVDVGEFFETLPTDATYISFSASTSYKSEGDIVLPDVQFCVIDGKGASLVLGPNSNGFTRQVLNQKMVDKKLTCRYVIRDFSEITGGKKAIDLQATLGSIVSNCRLHDQTEIAVDLRFCLMARIENVLVTNPKADGFVIRTGDWPGASATNSQSNSTVLSQCRVYCSNTTTNAYSVLNCGGVRLVDCISEGGEADRDLLLSAEMHNDQERFGSNPTMKSFTLENFHVEHNVRKESILVNMTPQASVNLSNIYWNSASTAPVIRYVRGQLNLSDIGWWTDNHRIISRVHAPRINVTRCHSKLRLGDKESTTATRSGSFELADPLGDGQTLDTRYIRVVQPSK